MVRHDLEEINMRRSMLGKASAEKMGTRINTTSHAAQGESVSYKSSFIETTSYEVNVAGHKIDSKFPVHHVAEPNPYRKTAVSRDSDQQAK